MNSPQFITDSKGNKLSVVLPMHDYEKILKELEELEDIRLYDEAMAEKEPSVPINEAFDIIEANRKKSK